MSADSDTPDDRFEELWEDLTQTQQKFVQAFLFTASKADAAREIGISPSTAYGWDVDRIEEVTGLLLERRTRALEEGIAALSQEAIEALRRALDPDTEVARVEAESAQYVVDRLRGKPTQKQEIETNGGIDLDASDEEALEDALSHFDEESAREGDSVG